MSASQSIQAREVNQSVDVVDQSQSDCKLIDYTMVLTQVFGTVVPTKVPSLTQLILPDLASLCCQLHLQCIQFHASWLALQYSQHTRLSLHTWHISVNIHAHDVTSCTWLSRETANTKCFWIWSNSPNLIPANFFFRPYCTYTQLAWFHFNHVSYMKQYYVYPL